MTIVPFEPNHFLNIRSRKGHLGEEQYALPPEEIHGQAYTLMRGDKPLLCMGRVPIDSGWHVWTHIDESADMRTVTRVVVRALSLCPGRIETLVRNGYADGERWARYLGFRCHGPHPEFKEYDLWEMHCP